MSIIVETSRHHGSPGLRASLSLLTKQLWSYVHLELSNLPRLSHDYMVQHALSAEKLTKTHMLHCPADVIQLGHIISSAVMLATLYGGLDFREGLPYNAA